MRLSVKKKWIVLSLRWIVGITFIVASIHKIEDPALFAKTIYGYGLFPHATINLIAIVLPFLELFTGILLLIGRCSGSAACIAGILYAGFSIAIAINIFRGHEFDCGCFSFHTEDSLFGKNFLLIRDVVMLIICAYLVRSGWEQKERTA